MRKFATGRSVSSFSCHFLPTGRYFSFNCECSTSRVENKHKHIMIVYFLFILANFMVRLIVFYFYIVTLKPSSSHVCDAPERERKRRYDVTEHSNVFFTVWLHLLYTHTQIEWQFTHLHECIAAHERDWKIKFVWSKRQTERQRRWREKAVERIVSYVCVCVLFYRKKWTFWETFFYVHWDALVVTHLSDCCTA